MDMPSLEPCDLVPALIGPDGAVYKIDLLDSAEEWVVIFSSRLQGSVEAEFPDKESTERWLSEVGAPHGQ